MLSRMLGSITGEMYLYSPAWIIPAAFGVHCTEPHKIPCASGVGSIDLIHPAAGTASPDPAANSIA